MTRTLESLFFSLLSLLPTVVMGANSAVFLQYHHVSKETPPSTSLTPERFAEPLDYLDDNEFVVEPITKVITAIQHSESLAEKNVVITFDKSNLTPGVVLTITGNDFQKKQLRCYASGQGEIPVKWLNKKQTRFSTSVENPLPVGRSRYNCTALSMDGRTYYWYSHQWLRLTGDGKAID